MNAPGNDNNKNGGSFLNDPSADHEPAEIALDTPASWDPAPNAGQFAGRAPLVAKPSASDAPDAVMSFKSASSNPMDVPLPLGRSYSEFPKSIATDSNPRDRFQDKVDVRDIKKGNPSIAKDTGAPHS